MEGGPEAGPDRVLHSLWDLWFFFVFFVFLDGFAMVLWGLFGFLGYFGFPNGFAHFSESIPSSVLGANTSEWTNYNTLEPITPLSGAKVNAHNILYCM